MYKQLPSPRKCKGSASPPSEIYFGICISSVGFASDPYMEPTLKMYCNVILCFARNNRIDDVVIYLSDLEKENLLTADKMNIHVLSRLYQDLISILWDEKANEDIIRRFIKEAYAKDCIIGFRGCLTQLIFDSFNEGNYAFAHFVLEQYVENKYVENTDDLKYLQFTRRLQSSLFLKVHHEEDKLNESNEEFQKLMKYIAYVDEKKMDGNLIGYSEAREKKKSRRRKKKKDNTMKMKKDMVREKQVKAPQIKNSYKNMYDNADEEKEIEAMHRWPTSAEAGPAGSGVLWQAQRWPSAAFAQLFKFDRAPLGG